MSTTSLCTETETETETGTAVAARAVPTLRDDERQRCEVWTRVMGYHRPASSFNIGKQGEFGERRYFEEMPAGAC